MPLSQLYLGMTQTVFLAIFFCTRDLTEPGFIGLVSLHR